MRKHLQNIIDLESQGASSDEIEATKLDLEKLLYDGVDNHTRVVSLDQFNKLKAAGECTDNLLIYGPDFVEAFKRGEL